VNDSQLIWERYQDEEGGTADMAVKVLVGIGLTFAAAVALSPNFRNWLSDQIVKGVIGTDDALTAANDRLEQQRIETDEPMPIPDPDQPPLDVPDLPR
jgi:hypothetical protein